MHKADIRKEYQREECARHLKSQEGNRYTDERSPEHANTDRDFPPAQEWNEPARVHPVHRSLNELVRGADAERLEQAEPDEHDGD